MEIRALIIDDEPLARNVILQYASKISFLTIVESFESSVNALEFLNRESVDLIFLDINMPVLSGISFLKTLKNPPLIIFTTAYTEYALESYELNALDYLKKPFSFERFLKSIHKASDILQANNSTPQASQEIPSKIDFTYIKANKKTYKVNFKDILFIEGLGDYIKLHLENQHIVTNLTMKKVQEILPKNDFLRIHKSFIISTNKIEVIEGNLVQIGTHKLPIGNSYRQDFFARINNQLPS